MLSEFSAYCLLPSSSNRPICRSYSLHVHLKAVVVDEVMTSIVGRVDIDHLHLAQIRLLQELEHFQIVALDVQFSVVSQFLLSSGQGRSVLRMGLLASTMEAFLPTHVNS